jgi:hypothetical protein
MAERNSGVPEDQRIERGYKVLSPGRLESHWLRSSIR